MKHHLTALTLLAGCTTPQPEEAPKSFERIVYHPMTNVVQHTQFAVPDSRTFTLKWIEVEGEWIISATFDNYASYLAEREYQKSRGKSILQSDNDTSGIAVSTWQQPILTD